MQKDPMEIASKVVDRVSAMLAYWSSDQRCLFSNAAYFDWFGRTREEMRGITLKELLGPLYEKNRPHIIGALSGERQIFEREIPLPDGTVRHSLADYSPDIVDGKVQGFIAHVADVTQMKKLELQAAKVRAEALATHDFLTGLPNRVLLEDRIATALLHANREAEMVAVVTMDLDWFKTINDTYGHECGDTVLKEVAARMKTAIRNSDTVTRLGGDEFILLATDFEDVEAVQAAVERVFLAVRRPLLCCGEGLFLGISAGVALFPQNGTTVGELMAQSDRALYRAKRNGRNRMEFVDG